MKMKKILAALGVIIAIVLLYFTVFSGSKQDAKVLVFSKTMGFRHESIEVGQEARQPVSWRKGWLHIRGNGGREG